MMKTVYESIGETVFTDVLDNGLTVMVDKKSGYAKKFAYFAARYGGADRSFALHGEMRSTPMGVAHFLEHKMFDMPYGNALTVLSENGASPNAYTSFDITAYFFECTEHFEENLKTLLEFVQTPYFPAESVIKEQGIIGQEIAMGDDNPENQVYYGLMKCLFKKHPIRDDIAGTAESIGEITPEILSACHEVFYNPSNMVLCVVGDVDENEVVSLAEKSVTRPRGENPVRDYGEENEDTVSRRFEKRMQIGAPIFYMGCRIRLAVSGEARLHDILTAELAAEILMGESSPLYARLYESGAILPDFSAQADVIADTAVFILGGQCRDTLTVSMEVHKEIKRISENGIDPDLFTRVYRTMSGNLLKALNDFDDICYNACRGVWGGYDAFRRAEVLRTITREDVRHFIAENLIEEKFAESVILPEEKEK